MTDQIAYNVTAAHITQTPGVCGGKPCIAGRRIRVYHIYMWHEVDGMSADEIAHAYDLSVAQVYAGLTYAFEHIDEIQSEIEEEKQLVEDAMRRHPSKLNLNDNDSN